MDQSYTTPPGFLDGWLVPLPESKEEEEKEDTPPGYMDEGQVSVC